jgi:hypothetical protein
MKVNHDKTGLRAGTSRPQFCATDIQKCAFVREIRRPAGADRSTPSGSSNSAAALPLCATILAIALTLLGVPSMDAAEDAKNPITADKTLVAWVSLANLNQRGGSVLTIQDGDRFDAIVFGERTRGKWMAGSDNFRRTQADQHANAAEAAGPDTLVQMAIVYEGDDIRIYRNGEAYASYRTQNVELLNAE